MKNFISDFALLSIGSALFSFGFATFLEPLSISPGGIAGVATVVSLFLPLPVGSLVFLLNLPLVIIGAFKLGKTLIAKTFISVLLSSVLIDVFSLFGALATDKMIGALAGGVFVGIGMSMIFLRGGTSGGTDIAAKLLRLKNPYFPIGRLILIMDGIIIGASALIKGDIESALYSVIYVLVSTYIIDKMLSDEGGKIAFIITKKPKEIKRGIFANLGRGVSEISALGGFSGENKTLIICALYKRQSADFRKTVKEYDPEAFSVILEASEVMGRGFN